jgi:sugar phosphate isomerase/epimerase
MPTLPIGAQLYTLRDVMPHDVTGTLRELAGLGYEGVEFAGLHGAPPAGLRAVLDDLGLKVSSAHVALDQLEADFERAADSYQTLGCPTLVVPWLPERRRGDYAALAETLNRLGERARAAGMRLAYHNHDFELIERDGTTGLQTLLEATDPALVRFELDCGWAAKIGRDPLELMRSLSGRLALLHIKDVTAGGDWAEVGQGVVDYRPVVEAAPELGVEWLIVEQDTTRRAPMESLAMSRQWLREHT